MLSSAVTATVLLTTTVVRNSGVSYTQVRCCIIMTSCHSPFSLIIYSGLSIDSCLALSKKDVLMGISKANDSDKGSISISR